MFVSNDLNYFHNGSMRCGSSQKIGISWRLAEHFAAVLSARRVSTQLLGVVDVCLSGRGQLVDVNG